MEDTLTKLEPKKVSNPREIRPQIISVAELLQTPNLKIPTYQRPYKWSSKNVHQLIDDILEFNDKPAYRLGTIVYHLDDDNSLNIIDGQQRTLTLLLIALAIESSSFFEKLEKAYPDIPDLGLIDSLKFKQQISKRNLKDNYRVISQRIRDFDVETAKFFFQRCQVVKVVLEDISEAFQFFDSQNARGLDLEPHDLLKAFHLREMQGIIPEDDQTQIVQDWQDTDQQELKSVFAYHLYRIRNWSKSKSAKNFTKDDVDVFKGISPNIEEPYPFASIYRISHFYIEDYNDNYNRQIDKNKLPYPFQLDQVIINGKRFFEMINHYRDLLSVIFNRLKPTGIAKKIMKTLDSYEGRGRVGDNYIHNLFKCALIFYIDKFGMENLDRAIEKFFIWAYSKRLVHQNVQHVTADNHAIAYPYIFKSIKEAVSPNDILNIPINTIRLNEIKATKVDKLINIFDQLKYIDER